MKKISSEDGPLVEIIFKNYVIRHRGVKGSFHFDLLSMGSCDENNNYNEEDLDLDVEGWIDCSGCVHIYDHSDHICHIDQYLEAFKEVYNIYEKDFAI